MTADKAIELLKTDLLIPGSVDKLDFQDAEQLGIEALKKWKEYRASDKSWWGNLLPGETE